VQYHQVISTIYALCDPRTSEVRYIGITIKPLALRLSRHLAESRAGFNNHRCNWIRTLLATSSVPTIVALEHTADPQREAWWIALYRAVGVNLTNSTDGGEGSPNLSAESRRRIGRLARQRMASEEAKDRIRASNASRVVRPETRQKHRARMLARMSTTEAREAVSRPFAGKPKSAETQRGRVVSESARINIQKAAQARGRNPESAARATRNLAAKGPGSREHCPAGHPYNEEHTFINVRGVKECRTCRRERDRSRTERRREDLDAAN
jgi:hypothetical protein